MDRSFVPSIVPSGHDQTLYLVINNFGNLGTAFPETDVDKADLETVIGDLMSGQYSGRFASSRSIPPNNGQLMCRKKLRMRSGAALILPAMTWRRRLWSSSKRKPVLRVNFRCD
jgi:hypothetical protein